jgi:hypothetical protein
MWGNGKELLVAAVVDISRQNTTKGKGESNVKGRGRARSSAGDLGQLVQGPQDVGGYQSPDGGGHELANGSFH